MMGKRKSVRTEWKAERKVQLKRIRKQKAIRLAKPAAKKRTVTN